MLNVKLKHSDNKSQMKLQKQSDNVKNVKPQLYGWKKLLSKFINN